MNKDYSFKEVHNEKCALENEMEVFMKQNLKDGNGVRYYNRIGQSIVLNYGYDKIIYGVENGISKSPYMKKNIGFERIYIPLK